MRQVRDTAGVLVVWPAFTQNLLVCTGVKRCFFVSCVHSGKCLIFLVSVGGSSPHPRWYCSSWRKWTVYQSWRAGASCRFWKAVRSFSNSLLYSRHISSRFRLQRPSSSLSWIQLGTKLYGKNSFQAALFFWTFKVLLHFTVFFVCGVKRKISCIWKLTFCFCLIFMSIVTFCRWDSVNKRKKNQEEFCFVAFVPHFKTRTVLQFLSAVVLLLLLFSLSYGCDAFAPKRREQKPDHSIKTFSSWKKQPSWWLKKLKLKSARCLVVTVLQQVRQIDSRTPQDYVPFVWKESVFLLNCHLRSCCFE